MMVLANAAINEHTTAIQWVTNFISEVVVQDIKWNVLLFSKRAYDHSAHE